MDRFRIKTIDTIAGEGLELFGDRYLVSADEASPQGIVLRSSPLELDAYPDLLAVARAGAGVNNIPVDRASAKGICIFNTPGANANAVVELVFTMLGIRLRHVQDSISFCRSLAGLQGDSLNREVEKRKKMFKGVEMAGKTLGIIGLGKVGVRVANTGVHHQMRVLGFDPYPVMDNIHDLSPEVELTRSRVEVLNRADFVSLHVPLNKGTQGMVSTDFLNKMNPGALLLNYARGPVVDEEAVLTALADGRLGGYITDFPSEKLVAQEKILLSPHLGASTTESEENCACMAVRELQGYLEYGNIAHSVNFPNVESTPTVHVRTRLIMINRDEPGMIGLVTNVLGRHRINIMSYANKSNGTIGYNIIDCAGPVPLEVQKEIEEKDGVIRTRIIRFGQ
ncbi:MAG TPA: 3-phosphoglycerate dehydrogenase [Desulfobacteraceae bacterium]|nr:D-3-phosphoglycerate dehydrogenase [bacterium BMS3Abin13]HDK43690.1 3-phosphoglycerate dehydrogenase [Desulfobacteraceae bacterium]